MLDEVAPWERLVRLTEPRHSLLRRLFVANAAVLVAATVLIAFLPVTVSWPITIGEAIVLVLGLPVILIANWLLLRRILTPLSRLRTAMTEIDMAGPREPVDVGAKSVEVAQLAASFNAMLERLAHERRQSVRRAHQAQEQERRALSLELHDEIGQNLTALLLQLDVASRSTSDPAIRQTLENAVETTRECLDQVRVIVRRLRPEVLDDLGLVGAIEHLCDRMAGDTGIEIDRALESGLPKLDPDSQLVVYRVTQESLTNIARHSGAKNAKVALGGHAGGSRLVITDDGIGLPEGTSDGSGIRGMRERALMIGAELHVAPREPSGTQVDLVLPAEDEA